MKYKTNKSCHMFYTYDLPDFLFETYNHGTSDLDLYLEKVLSDPDFAVHVALMYAQYHLDDKTEWLFQRFIDSHIHGLDTYN